MNTRRANVQLPITTYVLFITRDVFEAITNGLHANGETFTSMRQPASVPGLRRSAVVDRFVPKRNVEAAAAAAVRAIDVWWCGAVEGNRVRA